MDIRVMTWPTIISYFFGVWCSVYLVDAALRAHPCTRQWYIELTTRLGITLKLLHARIFTDKLNGIFHYICRFNCIPWDMWFSCGVLFSALFMLLSVCLLSILAYNTLMRKPIEAQVLTPVVPGVNLPINHLGFYVFTLFICAFLHEVGHALAAIRERVRLHGFGVFVFIFYPGAYVDLNTSDIQCLSPFSQLRVYCAGVWHNAVIGLLSVLILYMLPVILSPGYHLGSGVGVTYLREDSVVTGKRGFSLGDAIIQVNSCPVNTQYDWYNCLEEAYHHPSGYCVSGAYLNMLDNNVQGPHRSLSAVAVVSRPVELEQSGTQLKFTPGEDCCKSQLASTHLCFTYATSAKTGVMHRFACLPARAVTERTSCNRTSDCLTASPLRAGNSNAVGQVDGSGLINGVNPRAMYCVVPKPPDNSTRLVRLVHDRHKAPAILFLGPLEDLVSSVGVSDYVPRWPALLSPNLPHYIRLVCTYLFSLSGALVILNVIPCYALDGQFILQAFMDLCVAKLLPCRAKRNLLFSVILSMGSALLGVNMCLALIYLFLQANVDSQSTILPSASALTSV